MGKYLALKYELNKLAEQVEQARRMEQGEVIEHIRKLISEYQLTVRDVFGSGYPAGRYTFASAKYRDPETGRTWSGRGRPPLWLMGKDRTHFLIGSNEAMPMATDAQEDEKT
ncbi:H-NS histone family protein [Burkholderia ubonensis]|uniref:H-NS histone family protein n=1 Tax=Burkholderia ubonensis TaxID=101571 RepID=UPI0007C74AAD|nr:H-NS histone family protein [Burkholderia ubonensis]